MRKLLIGAFVAAAGLLSWSSATLAATMDLKVVFTSQLANIIFANPLGLSVGQSIGGTFLFKSFDDTPTVFTAPFTTSKAFALGPGTWSLSTGLSGTSTAGTLNHTNYFGLGDGSFYAENGSGLSFRLNFNGPNTLASLTDLNSLPTNAGIVLTIHQGYTASALYNLTLSSLDFQATPAGTAVTPLPAALPLFASALAGLGLAARRRRKPSISA